MYPANQHPQTVSTDLQIKPSLRHGELDFEYGKIKSKLD